VDTGKVYVKFVGNNVQDSQLSYFLMVDLSRSSNISYAMCDKLTSISVPHLAHLALNVR